MKDGLMRCGDHDALVSYLYDECDAGERERMRAHLAGCLGCTEELASLAGTREQLLAWVPPDVPLDLRVPGSTEAVTGTSEEVTGRVLRPARWWNRPLPAWGQAAAAAAIFAAGLAVGTSRAGMTGPMERADGPAPTTVVSAPVAGSDGTAAPFALGAGDLAAFEERVRGDIEARVRAGFAAELAAARAAAERAAVPAVQASPRLDEEALLRRVEALVERSEERQRAETAAQLSVLAREVDLQRRVDFRMVLDEVRSVNGQQRDAIALLAQQLR